MTRAEAIKHLEFMVKSYQNLIDNDVRSGNAIGKDFDGEWKAEQTLADAYRTMITSLKIAINSLQIDEQYDLMYEQAEPYSDEIRCQNAEHDKDGCLGYSTDRGGYSYCQTCLECPKASINNRDKEQEPCEDAISRQAVLEKQYRIDDSATLSTRDVVNVEDIEEMPNVTPTQNCVENALGALDCISRQAVLDGIEELKKSPWATYKRGNGFEYLITDALDVVSALCIKPLPSVNPQEPKTGHWIDIDDIVSECSECGHREPNERFIFEDINFCAKCGCRMVEPQESEEE